MAAGIIPISVVALSLFVFLQLLLHALALCLAVPCLLALHLVAILPLARWIMNSWIRIDLNAYHIYPGAVPVLPLTATVATVPARPCAARPSPAVLLHTVLAHVLSTVAMTDTTQDPSIGDLHPPESESLQ